MERKNIVKKCLFLVLISIVLLMVILIIARYEEEGEKEIPFFLSKILVVSSVDGENVPDSKNIWNIKVSGVNDIYVYIERKEDSEETIKSITFENFNDALDLERTFKIYKPTGELEKLYMYSEEDHKDKPITFTGSLIDDMKNQEIANIGGMCGFRIAKENLGRFVSNEENDEITYDGRLLEKINITEEQIKQKVSFDVIIETNDNIKYKTTLLIDMPAANLITECTSKIEITDFSNVVFKRQ